MGKNPCLATAEGSVGRPELDRGLCVILEMLIIAVTQLVCEPVMCVCVFVSLQLHTVYF